MGSGLWSTGLYRATVSASVDAGTPTFAYHATTAAKPQHQWKVHESLDPRKIKGLREARDSAEHPATLPVAVFFDVTGSMGEIPRTFQEKLPKLMTLLATAGGLADPQVLFGALGDAWCDKVPFQVGQFESDNRCDEQLRAVFLEAGGGGQDMESYDLAYYFAARKTVIDSWEKRAKKGYLFTIGDERFYQTLPASIIERVFGEYAGGDLEFPTLVAEAMARFQVFHITAMQGSVATEAVRGAWTQALGQRALLLDDAALVCELIASTVALCEGAGEVGDGLGLDHAGSAALSKALDGVRKIILE